MARHVSACFNHRISRDSLMRFLTISGPGVATDDEFCPYCHVLLEDRDGYQVCRLCHYDTR
jgi:hypothetical protein